MEKNVKYFSYWANMVILHQCHQILLIFFWAWYGVCMGNLIQNQSTKHGSNHFIINMHLLIERDHLQKSKDSIPQDCYNASRFLFRRCLKHNYVAYDWKHAALPNPIHGLNPLESGVVIRDGKYGIRWINSL